MGMAASQARYLALTARKSNVEYEGQQINQARTALANQSANTFNELLALDVPTAPSTQDYTTLQYSYEDGSVSEVITDMTALSNDPDGYNYLVTHYHYADIYTGVQSTKANPQVSLSDSAVQGSLSDVTYDSTTSTYTVNGSQATQYDPDNEEQKEVYETLIQEYSDLADEDLNNIYTYTDSDGSIHFTTKTDLENALAGTTANEYHIDYDVPTYVGNCEVSVYDPTDPVQEAAYNEICSQFPDSAFAQADTSDIYTWEYQGRTYYACGDDLRSTALSALDSTKPTENQSALTQYYAEDISTRVVQQEKAFVDVDENGRPYSIRFENSTAVLSLNTETVTDEDAYNDAMNQYNYEMQLYEKAIADINAKTEQIQQQDRTLELKLRQLDTEQEALQTEMEAVQKVIEKNIESTFKTFE